MKIEDKIYDLCGVYMITNIITNKIYIGSSMSLTRRLREHFIKEKNKRIKEDLDLFGITSFTYSIVEFISKQQTETHTEFYSRLTAREQHYIDEILKPNGDISFFDKNAYNTHYSALGPSGIKRSIETRVKCSEWQIGRKMPKEVVEKAKNTRIENHERKIKEQYGSLSNYKKLLSEKKNKARRKSSHEIKIKTGLPVACFDIDGNFIKMFPNQKEASAEYQISHGGVSRAISQGITSHKMYWSIYTDDSENGIYVKNRRYTLNDSSGNFIGIFENYSAIAKYIGCHHTVVSKYLMNTDTKRLLLGKYELYETESVRSMP